MAPSLLVLECTLGRAARACGLTHKVMSFSRALVVTRSTPLPPPSLPLPSFARYSSAAPWLDIPLTNGPAQSTPQSTSATSQKTNVNTSQGLKPFAFSFQEKAQRPSLVPFSRALLWGPRSLSFYHSPVPAPFAVATRNQCAVFLWLHASCSVFSFPASSPGKIQPRSHLLWESSVAPSGFIHLPPHTTS